MTGETHGPAYGQGAYPPGMRTSAADRDRVIEMLKAAFGEGRLTRDELETRTEHAMAATYYADLNQVVADLPVARASSGPPPAPAPAPYPRYYPGVPQATNGLAIASLVASALGFYPVGVVLGHVARSQIRGTGERGSGLATAGLVIGYAGLVAGVLLVLALLVFAGLTVDHVSPAARPFP